MKKTLLLTIFALFRLFTTVYSQECGTAFTDPAGPTTNYANSSDYTVTICPTNPGEPVTVTFTSFNTEAGWDALYVFNGNSISSPMIASTNDQGNVPGGLAGGYWGTTIPGPFTSSSPDGCLTFRFRSDGSINATGWIANVTCGPLPTCTLPSTLAVSAVNPTTAILSWTQPPNPDTTTPTAWQCLVVPVGSPAPTEGATGYLDTTSIPFTITGLSPATCYTFYVRAVCSATDHSIWAGGYNFCTTAGPPICGGQFVDNGGATGNYAINSDNTYTICPTNLGDVVTATFTSFNVEATWDALYVFNGDSISSPQIASTNNGGNVPGGLAGGYWGTTIPGPFTSSDTGGCLTFRFISDNVVNTAGWIANITCAPIPTCPTPSTLTVSNIAANGVTLGWTNVGSATQWEYIVLPSGSPAPSATDSGTIVTVNPATVTGLLSNTCYTFYVRAICSLTDHSEWAGGYNFCTIIAPPACGGQFVDNGGATANYANNSDNTYIVCPTNVGDIVTVTFDSFNTEATWDALYVFDGNSISSPQIASSNPPGNVPGALPGGFWGTTIPGPFTSTSTDGCLTFRFRSDASVTNPGWVANVICTPAPDRIVLVAFVDQNSNGVKDTNEPLFPNGSFVYQQNNDGININAYSPTGQYALYDSNPANTYSFSYQMQPEFTAYYNSGTTTYTNASVPVGSGTQSLYFPIVLTQSYNDVTISIAPISAPRPGFTYINKIIYKNQGVAATDGTITFVKPTTVTITAISQTGTVTNATGFTYAFTNLLPNETRFFYVTMLVPDAATVNSLLTDTASVSAPANDINLANNSVSNTQIVVNSLDPNDKMESRGKTVPFNQFAQDDYLVYTIRFQNEGTANAINIRIEDVLDSQIDEESVRMLSSSHNYTMKRIDNQLVWDFKDIYLPTITANPNGSIGYVQFKVQLNPGFQAGDIIPNTASIYFDTNPAIVTNLFTTKFTTPLSVTVFNSNSLVLYPNPATNTVQIGLVNSSEQINKVVFYDILGKNVKTVSTVATENLTVDVSDLSKGAYLVEIALENNLKVTKKLIIQ